MEEKKLYQCEACGLHYEDEQIAKECYEYCSTNNTCNFELIKQAVENKQPSQDNGNEVSDSDESDPLKI